MRIAIIGTNGMLSIAITKYLYEQKKHFIDVFGLDKPLDYSYDNFFQVNLLKDKLNYDILLKADVIIYAVGAGVQSILNTDSSLMYALNVNTPIEITLQLKEGGYKGVYISFGSYMEIGLNNEDGKVFSEEEVVCSKLPVTNDYSLSKRLLGRYMRDLLADYTYYHFILPNLFSEDDLKPGTRLIPYVLKYLQDYTIGNPTEKPSFSAGIQTRQYITLNDVMTVLFKSIELKIPSGVYCIGGGEFISIRSLIERLFRIYNVPCEDEYFGNEIRRDGNVKSLCINGSKLEKLIGFTPNTSVESIFNPNKK